MGSATTLNRSNPTCMSMFKQGESMTPEERRKAQVEKEIRGHRDELQRLGMPAPLIDAMFSFTADAGNYEERRIGRDDYPWGFISTCRVSDGAKPYETAVEHGNYNN